MFSKYIFFVFSILILIVLSSCKDNGISPQQDAVDTTWVQCKGLPAANVTGFAASGDNLVAGTYNQFLSRAYIYISFDNGYNWHLDATFHVYNHDTTTQGPHTNFYLSTPVTFIRDGNYLLAGIGGALTGGIYISTDQGISWSNKGISWASGGEDTLIVGWKDINDFAILESNIFVGTNLGVFRSTDHGYNWVAVNNGLPFDTYNAAPQVMSIVVQGTDLFAGTTGEGLFRSTDNGENWAEADGGKVLDVYGLAAIGSNLLAGGPENGMFLTTDKGQSWSQEDSGLINNKDRVINCLDTNGKYLFAGTNNGLFISTDQGTSWKYVNIGNLPANTYAVISLAVINKQLYIGTHYSWRYPISEIPKLIQIEKSQK